jgi:hypothetical protein
MPENKTDVEVPVADVVSALPPDIKPLDVTPRMLLTVIRQETAWKQSDDAAAQMSALVLRLFKSVFLSIRQEYDDEVSAGWAKGTLTSTKTPRIRAERNSGGETPTPKTLDEEFGD